MTGDLDPLHPFLGTLGGGAATLLGLLFVSVSINVRRIVEHEDTKELARQLGIEMAATSLVLIVQGAPRFVRSFRRERSHLSRRAQVLRFGLGLFLQTAALAIAVDFLVGDLRGASWLIAVELSLLAGAARNSWELLVELGNSAR
ncbi:hypothetical protein [Sinomonas gamaensis]|uniref:hypothetical protein n=1 Tax=Sinomonas gamaensis TaxID=2565624 RepID=UPI001109A9DC|nr:hypothetical protein [Sinomonas gamaensis]